MVYIRAMTREERREQEKLLKKEMILDTAERLIFTRGFENVNFNDIADAAGYTRRSIYLYFKDRDDIFFNVVLRGQRLFLSSLESAELGHRAGEDTVDAFCGAVFEFADEHPEYLELILTYELRKHDYSIGYSGGTDARAECQNISVDYGSVVSRAIAEDLAAGKLTSSLSAGQLMLIFWGQLFGFMQIIIQRSDNFSGVYGIEQAAILGEFKEILKRMYR